MNLSEIAPGLRYEDEGFWVTPDAVDTSYPEFGNDFCYALEDESLWFAHRNSVITAAVQQHEAPGALIFDVGAGNGYVASALQRAGFLTIAIEPNRSGAANAVKRGLESVVCGHLPSPAFRNGTADAIGLFDVVEHIEADRAYLESLRPYLKPGGRLYVTAPAYQWLWSNNDVIGGHYRRYTLSSLRHVMESAGYRVDYGSYFFAFLPLPIFLLRSLPSRLRRAKEDLAWNRSPAHHGVLSSRALRLAQRVLAFETRRTARGKSIPFGGSCLIVAQRL
jgi:SAM-dependent methyltransferase